MIVGAVSDGERSQLGLLVDAAMVPNPSTITGQIEAQLALLQQAAQKRKVLA